MADKNNKSEQVKLAAIKNLLQRKAEGSSIYLEPFASSTYPSSSRLFALFHPMAPKEALTKHYHSWYWLERYAIA